MRVLFLRPTLELGGVATRLALLCSALVQKGHWVGVATADTGWRLRTSLVSSVEVFHVHLHPSTTVNLASSIVSLRRIVNDNGVEVLSSHHRFASIAGKIVAWMTHASLVCTLHEFQEDWRMLLPLWTSEYTVVPSHALLEHMLQHYRMMASDLTVIPAAIDTSLRPNERCREELKESLGIVDGLTVCYVGRLSPEKGVRYFLESMPLVRERLPDARFLIVGEGPEEQALKQHAQDIGLDPPPSFLGPRTDVPEILDLITIAVLPSVSESFGLAALEAMRASRPVVATAVGGIPEVVRHGETGLLVPPRSSQALADAICTLLAHPGKRQHFGQRGFDIVRQEHDASVMAERYLEVYRLARKQRHGS